MKSPTTCTTFLLTLSALLLPTVDIPPSVSAAETVSKAIPLREALVLPPLARAGRSPTHVDPVEAEIVAGTWKLPKKGDKVGFPKGPQREWGSIMSRNNLIACATITLQNQALAATACSSYFLTPNARDDGWFSSRALAGGYASFTVEASAERVMVLEAAGHLMVYVNGEPRAGDVYSHGYVRVPVNLRKGANSLLFLVGRGQLKADLVPPKADVFFNMADVTAPDLAAGLSVDTEAAVVVVNASKSVAKGLSIMATLPGGKAEQTILPQLPPLSVRKIGFRLKGTAPKDGGCEVALEIVRNDSDVTKLLDRATLRLGVAKTGSTHKVTFRSGIDGSVQYYSLVPASPGKGDPTPGLILTLHGAGVEGSGQAACFARKPWAHVVAPTNRRPYGFDWEDWGRLDAMEVLAEARRTLKPDLRRSYLTGHSMGGHGSWHLAVTFPDEWAAVGPSAGWVSMWSYAGLSRTENLSPIRELIGRCMSPSDTLALSRNLSSMGVYVLHGDKDDNVSPEQAHTMRTQLATFHKDFAYHEQKGAGHWWGNACVDWPPMLDFFQRFELPRRSDVREVDFRTASPGVSARCNWAVIEAQTKQLKLSSVRLNWDPKLGRFAGTTDNVARLCLDVSQALDSTKVASTKAVSVELDGQKIGTVDWPEKEKRIWIERANGKWAAIGKPAPSVKGPHRYGTFKDAFRNRVIFVFGTRGAAEENAWAFAKARFDAETFWYRGNASIDVVADTDFDPNQDRDRNVVLYGNAETNLAWKPLLGTSPVQVLRGKVQIGDHDETGDNLACLLIRPRPASDTASVAAVAGSGVVGMRLTDRIPCFSSGVEWPDCVVLSSESLKSRDVGVLAAGFFGIDWGVKSGEFAFVKK